VCVVGKRERRREERVTSRKTLIGYFICFKDLLYCYASNFAFFFQQLQFDPVFNLMFKKEHKWLLIMNYLKCYCVQN
jgi:hypothetical protein